MRAFNGLRFRSDGTGCRTDTGVKSLSPAQYADRSGRRPATGFDARGSIGFGHFVGGSEPVEPIAFTLLTSHGASRIACPQPSATVTQPRSPTLGGPPAQ